ncbi:hypothetical protein MBLNU230_g4774t1 [Neophaeotheca triangularis]
MGTESEKSNILVIGFGGIGTITALNLEAGNLATVTGVLRSNYDLVQERGFNIWSIDYGHIPSWRPTNLTKTIPNPTSNPSQPPFDYIVICTKNLPDIPPTISTLITPAITPSHTAIVLIQNGLNIEKPFLQAFPTNILISGISQTSSTELEPGKIFQQDHDILRIGAFRNANLDVADEQHAAKQFCHLYNASGKPNCQYDEDVAAARWQKLVYNASWNSVCAITGLDTTAIKVAETPVTELVLPVMREIRRVARAAGVVLGQDVEDKALAADPFDGYFRPSMQQDVDKGNFMEIEVIVGEPVREAQRLGVPVPTLTFVYSMLKALQARTKQRKGLVEMPPQKEFEEAESLARFRAS